MLRRAARGVVCPRLPQLTQAQRPPRHAARRYLFVPGLGPPGASSNKIGFTTYAMWGLCVVVVCVCYVIDQNEPAPKDPLPDDVHKILPSGAYLMKDGSIQKQGPAAP